MNDGRLSEEYRDELAKAVAPYTAPKLSSVTLTKRPAEMTDEEIAKLIGLTEEDMLRPGDWPRPMASPAALRALADALKARPGRL